MASGSKKNEVGLASKIEVYEPLEEHFGIRFDALCSRWGGGGVLCPGGEYKDLYVNGEVHPVTGTSISKSFQVIVAVYDSEGRVMASEDVDPTIESGKFFGFESFSAKLYIPASLQDRVSKVLVYPAPF